MADIGRGMIELARTVIAAWFMWHWLRAKKIYIKIVITSDETYIPTVEPISKPRQRPDPLSSIFCRQSSAHEWARSTSRIKPSRRKSMAHRNAM